MDVDAPVEGREGIGEGRDGADTNRPLISVIVPIYNVEKYVRKCLESLRGQTLKQIEVICVDDGSTDESGRIADEYCNTDEDGSGNVWPIFRVIHHSENRGLSAARNTGIDAAVAEWIMLVDSDDWVEPGFCEIPYETTVRENADLVIFQADTVKRGKKYSRPWDGPVGAIDEMTAHEYGFVAVWNKLYKKNLYNHIRYPEGHVYEDSAITHKLVHKAEKAFLIKDIFYHHTSRRRSIIHTSSAKNKRDCFIFALERQKDLVSYGYSKEKLDESLCASAIGYLASTKDDGGDLYNKAVEAVNKTEGIPKRMTWKQKAALRAWRMDKRAFYILSELTGRIGKI